MRFKKRPKVALLMESSRSYGRDLLRGAARFARTRSNWSILHQEMTIDAQFPQWLKASEIDGVIARVDTHTIDQLRGLDAPIVDVRCRHRFDGIPQVETDEQAVAQLAFDHLWDRGFRRFAYCGFQHAHYSVGRLRGFRKLVEDAGVQLSVHESPGEANATLSEIEEVGLSNVESVSAWLQSLTPPTGLFVCNDIRGQQVLNVCRSLGIAVPDDIGVIGVDDDDTTCLLCDPPLSSVRPSAERIGFRAAEILQGMMNGESAPESVEYVLPTRVVQRLSTQVSATEDRVVARVRRFIREHACDGIDVSDVTAFLGMSRRQLERRFRAELDRTLHQEITAVQVDRVKQLLCETDMTLEQITPLAGYSHRERLSAVFRRETGESPGQYRQSMRAGGE